MFFSLLFSKDFLWIEKSGAAGNEPCCMIRRCPKNVRAGSKVDKNLGKCVIFVYRLVEIQGARARK